MVNTILAKRVNHIVAKGDNHAWPKGSKSRGFSNKDGNDVMAQQIQRNYDRIKADAQAIVNDEMERIKGDPGLCRRLGLGNDNANGEEQS